MHQHLWMIRSNIPWLGDESEQRITGKRKIVYFIRKFPTLQTRKYLIIYLHNASLSNLMLNITNFYLSFKNKKLNKLS